MAVKAHEKVSDRELKEQLELEIKHAEESEVSLPVAQAMLGIGSVDKEYNKLKQRAWATQFSYEGDEAKPDPRPYQIQTLEALERLLKQRAGTVAVQLPTGSGKTFVIHEFIHRHFRGKNVLIVTPSWEIANQHAMTVCKYFKDGAKRVRRLGGRGQLISVFEEFAPAQKGKIIITTSALFYARQKILRERLKVGLVIVDEGHHGWKKKRLNSVRAFARENAISDILLTATPPQNMEHLPFAAELKYLDLVPEYLVQCHVVRLDTGEEFDPVLNNGVLSQTSRVEISARQTRFEKIVASSLPLLKGQTIYYAGSVLEAMGVAAEYKKHGLSSVVVHSKWESQGSKINALAIEKFRGGLVQVLVNVQMLSMGFDVPNVETIVVARPVESDTLFTQMVGRGARPAPGKDRFILIDVHDTISKPDVAKIFEHKHLFYNGTEDVDLQPLEMESAPAKVILLPLQPRPLQLELEFKRSQVIHPYFLHPYQAIA